MEITFFIAGVIALATTVGVISCSNAVHALLYLVVSLLSVAVIFFALGAPFAATLEVIIYAGAVMVLFVFVVMMLNFNAETQARERYWLRPKLWIGPGIMAGILLLAMLGALIEGPGIGKISGQVLEADAVGAHLFGPYVLVAELAAFLLLAALVVAAHVGREDRDVDEEAAMRDERGPKAEEERQ